jgi:uncharacterized protein YeaO (DUF488 family)
MKKPHAGTERDVIVSIKRAYASPGPHDGYRVLVDRLWPRAVSKADACIDEWWKEHAPSTALRKWFNHDPAKWRRFKQRYTNELEANRDEVARSVNRAGHGPITLVYGAKDEQHNQAIVLREFIETRILGARVS